MAARDDAAVGDSYTGGAERKTETDSKSQQLKIAYKTAKESNPLNKYRSFTYNFTLAGLKKSDLAFPDRWRESELDLVILRSGGKGDALIKMFQQASAAEKMEVYDKNDATVKKSVLEDETAQYLKNLSLVAGFNQNSPGRFDMFIDSVEIETLMAFTKDSGTTLPVSIKFDVIEPYSINGFVEALQAVAVASGYPNYALASYILKVDFIGYPDDDNLGSPEILKNYSRYFVFRFTGLEVDLNERGTLYRCAAVPTEQMAFGQTNELKRPVTMVGSKVNQILTDLTSKLTSQIKADFKEANPKITTSGFDEYAVAFPTRDSENKLDYTKINEIGMSDVNDIVKDSNIYKFEDPGTTNKENTYSASNNKTPAPSPNEKSKEPERFKLHPTKGNPPQVQFAQGQKIHEIIAALVRDSEYIKRALETKNVDSDGFFPYFLIKTEVVDKPETNPVSRKPFQKITYSIIPYKIHFTRIPTLAGQFYPSKVLEEQCLREYNYLYTGKNIDVLKFKLNFNTLYFEAIPAAMGNNTLPGGKDAAGKSNSPKVELKGDNMENSKNTNVPVGQQQTESKPVQAAGGNAGQPQYDDPYYALARNLHESVINSKTSMITGDIEILGDPFFLVTGGIGNYNPATDGKGKTKDGEADYLSKEVIININFRNPVDVDTFENGGRLIFDSKRLPFSGVYMVTKCVSTFKNGEFVQKLEIIRKPGQILNDEVQPTNLKDKEITTPAPGKGVLESTSRGASSEGSRASELDSMVLLGRGLPSPGLPGQLSNFVNAVGGLGGAASSLLNQAGGTLGQVNNALGSMAGASSSLLSVGVGTLNNVNATLGSGIAADVNQLASGIRLQTAGLLNQTNIKAVSEAAKQLSGQASSLIDKYGVPGSGIGQGASVLISPGALPGVGNSVAPAIGDINAFSKSAASSAKDVISNFSNGVSTSIGNLKAQASVFANNVKENLTKLSSSLQNDPTAIAAQFGINPSQLSGLSQELQSKIVPQLKSLSEQIPQSTDLPTAINKGLLLKYVPANKLQNLPPTSDYSVAPKPEVDRPYLSSLVKGGNVQALADAFGTLNIKNISSDSLPAKEIVGILSTEISALSNAASQLNKIDSSLLGDKISSLGSRLTSSAGDLTSKVSGSIGSLNGVTSQLNTALSGSTNALQGAAAQFGNSLGALGTKLPTAAGSLKSVEAQLSSLSSSLNDYVNSSGLKANLEKSVTAQFGSLNTDLGNVVNRLGDPNAPQYTGNDPIIRARLGLPLKKE